MPGTTSTALPSFSHDQDHETEAAKQKRGDSVVTTTAINLSFNKIQNGDNLVPANLGPFGIMAVKRDS